MTVVSEHRGSSPARRLPPLAEPPGSRWPLAILLAGFGLLFTAAGIALRGSSWILPDGLLGGGIALIVCAPLARSMLEPLVVSSPFMFYTLSPVGGILTVGSSDALLPVFVFLLLAGAALARGRRPRVVRPPVPAAMPLIMLTLLLCTASTVLWTVLSPDFLAARSIADTVKLAAGVGYLMVVFILVRRVGMEGALQSFRLWGWTATALSLGSLAGITGAVEIIPSDGYRSLGYFQDANLYAGYLLVSLSVLIFLGTVSTPAVSSRWLPVQAVVILGGIVTTGSRGGMLSLALLVAFATLIINSAKLRLMVLAGIGVVTAAGWWLLANRDSGVTVLGLDRLFFASKTQAVEDDPRVALWVRAIEKWLDAPIWGIGAGQFERFSGDVFRVAKSSGLGYVTHNSFLFFLVSFGVIGFGLFAYLLWWIVRDLYRAPHLNRNAQHALASGIVVILSQMMTLNLQNLRYVWIYFGLVLGVAMLERGERRGQQRP
ncbi:MAG: O-antigen ligase family protein [Nocardioides sp.]|nr:O-antigen ligase family protein [Nocardioides sp.]